MNLHVHHYFPKPTGGSLFFFYWNIFTLQYCISFCYTTKWVSHMHMCPPSWTSLPPQSHLTPLGHHRAPCWASCAWYQLPTISYWYLARMAPNCMWNQEGFKWHGQPAAQAYLVTWFILQLCWLHIYTIRTLVPSFINLQQGFPILQLSSENSSKLINSPLNLLDFLFALAKFWFSWGQGSF